MIKKALIIFFIIFMFCNTAFAHTADIVKVGENRYKAIRLTPRIYNLANNDLSDIRIKDETGKRIPYFINSSYLTTYKGSYNYPLTLIDSYEKDDFFYFDYKLDQDYDQDILTTSIALTTGNEGFAKKIKILGSYDGVKWTDIQEDTIYNVDSNKKLEINFDITQKYTHYRFKLSNNLEKISFVKAELYYSEKMIEKSYFTEKLTPQYTVEEKEKETHINISGLKNLKLNEITISTDSIFKRAARTPNGIEEIYNLTFEDEKYSDTTIQMNQYSLKDDILTVVIYNNDDRPIEISSIGVKYFADELVFDGSLGQAFKLEFSADPAVQKPTYDIENYKNDVLRQKIDKLEISNISVAEPVEKEKESDYTPIFNATVIVVAIILGFIILRKLKK